jgi:hypothetical protein
MELQRSSASTITINVLHALMPILQIIPDLTAVCLVALMLDN